ncbi:unnamed protein product [Lota lota]
MKQECLWVLLAVLQLSRCKECREIPHLVVHEGARVQLHCAEAPCAPGVVPWTKEERGDQGTVRRVSVNATDRHNSPARCSLTVQNTEESDSGLYYCGQQLAAQLVVLLPGTRRYNISTQDDVTLACPWAAGRPAGTRVSWRRRRCEGDNSYHFPRRSATAKQRFFSETPAELLIRNATRADSGMYFCNGTVVGYLNVTRASGASGSI